MLIQHVRPAPWPGHTPHCQFQLAQSQDSTHSRSPEAAIYSFPFLHLHGCHTDTVPNPLGHTPSTRSGPSPLTALYSSYLHAPRTPARLRFPPREPKLAPKRLCDLTSSSGRKALLLSVYPLPSLPPLGGQSSMLYRPPSKNDSSILKFNSFSQSTRLFQQLFCTLSSYRPPKFPGGSIYRRAFCPKVHNQLR